MKAFFRKLAVSLSIITVFSTTFAVTSSTPVLAEGRSDGNSCSSFLGMTNWDCGVTSMSNETELTNNIVKIATNVLTDLTVIAAYLILGYVIYGGYLYMFSSGSADKVAAGKKTLLHAFIGLAIVVSAYSIFSAIRIALIGDQSLADCSITKECVDSNELVTNLIQWIGGIGGVVAAIFLVVGGWGYLTSAGDSGKLEKAKKTLIYAIVGLIVVAFAEIITGFISNLIREANEDTSSLDRQISININKEKYEKG